MILQLYELAGKVTSVSLFVTIPVNYEAYFGRIMLNVNVNSRINIKNMKD